MEKELEVHCKVTDKKEEIIKRTIYHDISRYDFQVPIFCYYDYEFFCLDRPRFIRVIGYLTIIKKLYLSQKKYILDKTLTIREFGSTTLEEAKEIEEKFTENRIFIDKYKIVGEFDSKSSDKKNYTDNRNYSEYTTNNPNYNKSTTNNPNYNKSTTNNIPVILNIFYTFFIVILLLCYLYILWHYG